MFSQEVFLMSSQEEHRYSGPNIIDNNPFVSESGVLFYPFTALLPYSIIIKVTRTTIHE